MTTITRGGNKNSFNSYKKANIFMRGKISEKFYKNAMNHMNYYTIKNKKEVPSGFAILQPIINKGIYIHLFATKPGFGRILLERIINNARKNDVKYIKLDSIPSANGFYYKHGFNNNDTNFKMILKL